MTHSTEQRGEAGGQGSITRERMVEEYGGKWGGTDHVESARVLPGRESNGIQSIKHKDRPACGRLVHSEDRTDGKWGPLGRVNKPGESKKDRQAPCVFIQRGYLARKKT